MTLAAGKPVGLSLHVALNEVDPNHYAGWRGVLNACEFDAEDMEALAKQQGYKTTSLIREAATRQAVTSAIADAAGKLGDGDMFFLTYSGHGGRIDDYSGDEADRLDETWCLFDGQLIDDELYQCWQAFAAGVRILLISDSCHSGSVYRSQNGALVSVDASGASDGEAWGEQARAMPHAIGARTYRLNRDFYRSLADDLFEGGWKHVESEEDFPVKASLRHLSGCMDHQFSYDGVANGHFTERLLKVWAGGKFSGTYEQFHAAILQQMRADQTPCHATLGSADRLYDTQQPFTI